MSAQKKKKPNRRAPRLYSAEFKADAVNLVNNGKSFTQVVEDLDLSESALREWVKRAAADAGVGDPNVLTSEELQELARLRRENKQLRTERAILEAAATFFAKENA